MSDEEPPKNDRVALEIVPTGDAIRAELRGWTWTCGRTLDEISADPEDKGDRFWAECELDGAELFVREYVDALQTDDVAPLLSIGEETVIYNPTLLDCISLRFKVPEIFADWLRNYVEYRDDEDEEVTQFIAFLRGFASQVAAALRAHKARGDGK
jgi:hypothetical protein